MSKWTDKAREDLAGRSARWTDRARADIMQTTDQPVQVTHAQRVARRDDGATRERFAQAHPEYTGGLDGAMTRAANTNLVQAQAQVKDAQERYDAATKRAAAPASSYLTGGAPAAPRASYAAVEQGRQVREAVERSEPAREMVRLYGELYDAKKALGYAQAQKAEQDRERELLADVSTSRWDQLIRDRYADTDVGGVVSEEEVRSQRIKAKKGMIQAEQGKLRQEMDAQSRIMAYEETYAGDGWDPLHPSQKYAAAKERYDAAKENYDRLEADLNWLSGRDYSARNESGFGRLAVDGEATGKYADAAKVKEDQRKLNEVIGYYMSGASGGDQEEYDRISKMADELYRDYGLGLDAISAYVMGQDTPPSGGVSVHQAMERMEALLSTRKEALEGAEGEKTGYDFEDLYGYQRRVEKQQEAARQAEETARIARENPLIGSAATAGASLFQLLDVLNFDPGKGKPGDVGYIPPDTSGMAVTNFIQTVRGTISHDLARSTDWELWGQNVPAFLYNTGMSMADSALAISTLGTGSVYLMGLNSAVNTAKEVVDGGGTTDQALKLGLASGAAEILFEKFSVDSLLKPRTAQGWRDVLKQYVVQQGLVELSEEALTETANILAEVSILGQSSDYAKAVEGYRKAGDSEDLAKRKAFLDMAGRVGWAGAGGFVSGAGMGAGKAAVDYAASSLGDFDIRTLFERGRSALDLGTAQGSTDGSVVGVDTPAAQNAKNGAETAQDVPLLLKPALEAQQKTASTGEAGTGLVPISDNERRQLSTGKRNFFAETVKDIVSFARSALAKKGGPERLYMGVIPDSTAKMTMDRTGFDVSGFKAVLTGDAVQHTRNNHGDPIKEDLKGQRAVTPEDWAMLGRVLAEPDDVWVDGKRDSNGRPVIMFSKKIGDVYVTAQAFTEGRHTLTTDSMRIQKGKSHQDTAPDAGMRATGPVLNVQDAPSEGSSSDIVPQTTPDVKPGDGAVGVGAAAARFQYQEADTQSVGDRSFTDTQMAENPALKNTHKVYTDAEARADAEERLAFDYEGEKASLETMPWGAAEQKMGHMILEDLVDAAVKSGDYTEVIRWKKIYDQKGGTEPGQALHARREYSDSTPHVIARAAEFLESDQAKKMSAQRRDAIMANVTAQATALGDLADGDTAGVIDLIKQNSLVRRTTGLFSKKTAKTLDMALNRVAETEGGYDFLKRIAAVQVNSIATDYAGKGALSIANDLRMMFLLSKVSTVMRNVLGNQIFDLFESVSTDVGVLPDMLMSIASGRRTTAVDKSWASSAKRKGSVEAALKSYISVALDADMDTGVRYEGTSGRSFKMTGNPVSRFLSTLAKFQNYTLTTTDEFAKGGTQAETQRGIDALKSAGKLGDGAMDGWADEIAKQRTFQNDGRLSGFTIGGRRLANNLLSHTDKYGRMVGLGDAAVPFARVPANLPARLADYTPVGLIKSGGQLIHALIDAKHGTLTPERQARVALNVGRGLNGSAALALFTFLGYMGAITVAGDDDENKEKLEKAQRKNGTQWNLTGSLRALQGESGELRDGDHLLSVGWLEPVGGMLSIGALLGEELRETDELSVGGVLGGAVDATASGIIQSIMDTPAMSSIREIETAYKYADGDTVAQKVKNTAVDYASDQLTSFLLPNMVKGIAQGTDNVVRDPYATDDPLIRLIYKTAQGIPGLRQTVPAAVDGFGRERSYTDDPLINLINATIGPGQLTTYHQTKEEAELERVSDATKAWRKEEEIGSLFPSTKSVRELSYTDKDGKEHKTELTEEQSRDFQKVRGTTQLVALSEMMGTKGYQRSDDKTKAELLKRCYDYARNKAKAGVLGEDAAPAWVEHAQNAKRKMGLSTANYLCLLERCSGVRGIKGKDGKSIPNSKGLQVMEAVYAAPGLNRLNGLNAKQRQYLFESLGVGESVRDYTEAQVKGALRKMR